MKKVEKKLSLGKVTVAKLSNEQLSNVNGATGVTYMYTNTCKAGCSKSDGNTSTRSCTY